MSENIVLSTNHHWTDKRAVDLTNSTWADGYYTLDLGVRYSTKKLLGKETIFRTTLNNVFDKQYWASIYSSNEDPSTGSAATTLFLGEGRNFMASVEVKF